MKKLLLTLVALLSAVATQAQTKLADYQSMIQEGRIWVNHVDSYDGYHPESNYTITYSYELYGDSLLNGHSYKKCYMKAGDKQPVCTDADYSTLKLYRSEPVALIREEGMKVYVILCDHPGIGLANDYDMGVEYVAYDFERARDNSPRDNIITQESVNGVLCNHYMPTDYPCGYSNVEMLESVGACSGFGTLLFPEWVSSTGFIYDLGGLSCVLDNQGNIIYKSPKYREPTRSGIVDIHKECVTDDSYYNLQGQRVSEPAAGIYIHNGKKVIVK